MHQLKTQKLFYFERSKPQILLYIKNIYTLYETIQKSFLQIVNLDRTKRYVRKQWFVIDKTKKRKQI